MPADPDLAKLKATPNINEPWLETWTATIAEVYRLRAAVERLTKERDGLAPVLEAVRIMSDARQSAPIGDWGMRCEESAHQVLLAYRAYQSRTIRALENPNG